MDRQLNQTGGTGVMIPICVAVSRKTGKVIRTEYIDGTPEEVLNYVRTLKRIGRTAQRVLAESK